MIKYLLKYQHSISKTEKSILFLHRSPVSIHRIIISHKSGDQHNKRAFGQVEIGDKTVKDLEFVAGINENIRVALRPQLWSYL